MAHSGPPVYHDEIKILIKLSLTCRALRDIAQPFLYHVIYFGIAISLSECLRLTSTTASECPTRALLYYAAKHSKTRYHFGILSGLD